jgi:predicted Zn-dependent protease
MPPAVFREPSAVSEEDRRALESLGYLSSSSRGGGASPDPKDKIATLRFYHDGLAQLREGNARAAAVSLRQFVIENPDMSDGWVALAQAQAKSGDGRSAMESLRVAMTRFPESPIVVLSMASALFERGQLDEAEKHARLVLDSDPIPAHELLASMAEKRGDLAKAAEHLTAVLERAPANVDALVRLARLHARAGRFGDAATLFDRAVAVGAPARDVQFDRGETLLQLGRIADAEGAYRAEVTAFPDNLRAWGSLAVVQHVQGKRDDAIATLAEAIRRNPGPRARAMAAEVLRTVKDGEGMRRLNAALAH